MTNDELVTRYLDQIRGGLDSIEELLESEPKTLASSVLRLTDICNILEHENASLRNELGIVQERYDELRQSLASTDALLHVAEQRVKSLRATCSKVMADAGVTELRASNVMLLRRNKKQVGALQVTVAKLRAEIDKQNKYIQILKKGRVYARTVNRWSPHP